jgi:putative transposase
VACLQADIGDLLTHFSVPPEHRMKVRTTNAIERAFREARRRTKPMSCFNNPASIERIVFAVFAHLNSNWEKRARSFTQET